MKEKYKKYIGNKAFYMMVMAIAVPIMIQNGLTNFVNLLDNIMVGRLGTEEMSGVSIVNQIIFVYNLCIFGGTAGVGIFTAQYFGQKNDEGIQVYEYVGILPTIPFVFNNDRLSLWMKKRILCKVYSKIFKKQEKPNVVHSHGRKRRK